MVGYLISFCLGGFLGVTVMCLCFAASESDKDNGKNDNLDERSEEYK